MGVLELSGGQDKIERGMMLLEEDLKLVWLGITG